jgi:hypothetical protein
MFSQTGIYHQCPHCQKYGLKSKMERYGNRFYHIICKAELFARKMNKAKAVEPMAIYRNICAIRSLIVRTRLTIKVISRRLEYRFQ